MKSYFIKVQILCTAVLLFSIGLSAQVTIGSDLTPNKGSIVDLKQNDSKDANSNKGLLFSRVELVDINDLEPCIAPADLEPGDKENHIGLVVYNITDDPDNGLCPGIYVWEGNNWTRLPEPCQTPVVPVDPDLINSPNCYIVAPNTASVEIPVAKAFLVSEQRSDLSALNRESKVFVQVYWQDTQDLIDKVEFINGDEGIHSKFKVYTKNNGKAGNALVTLHVGSNGDKNDPVAWSWHIWVTDYDPENGGTTYSHNNGDQEYIFMDRSLGAITTTNNDAGSMGYLYQWGRKDPFPPNNNFGTSPGFRTLYDSGNGPLTEVDELQQGGITGTGIQHEEVSAVKNLANSILYPWKYYYAKRDDTDTQSNRSDWFTSDESGSNTDNDLWGGVSAKKSVFDPCPEGWKVPAVSSSGKSPWVRYEGLMNMNVTWNRPYGFVLKNISSAPATGELGFYAFHFPRMPRAVNACYIMGCQGEDYAGGAFAAGSVMGNVRGGFWTATAGANNLSAKATGVTQGFDPSPTFKTEDAAKSGGLTVRCVRAN